MTKRFQIDDDGDISEFDSNGKWVDSWQYANGKHWENLCGELNQLYEENEQLKSEYKLLHTQYQDLKKFVENNFDEYLTQEKLNRQIIKLSDENEQLKKRNENQYKQLQHLWSLMEAKDWETLSEMVNQMEEDEKQLQQEWKCYE